MVECCEFQPRDRREQWAIVFMGQTGMPLLNRFLSPGYRHVIAIKKSGRHRSLIVQQLAEGLFIDYYPVSLKAATLAVCADKNYGSVVYCESSFKLRYIPRGLQSCVSVVKSLLGIRAWHIITPKQLHDYLIKHGAQAYEKRWRHSTSASEQQRAGSAAD